MRQDSAFARGAAAAAILCSIAAPAGAQAQATSRRATRHTPATHAPPSAPAAPTHAAPSIVLSPQITVPPAPPAPITVQAAPPAITVTVPAPAFDPTRWIAVFAAIASAVVSVISMLLAWRSQTTGLRKDAAALLRDLKAKEANAVIQAFENNVARPIGTLLDHIERLTNDLLKIAPVAADQTASEEVKYAGQLSLDRGNMLRLCREADGCLARERPPAPFSGAFGAMSLDVTLFLAASEVLRGGDAAPLQTTLDTIAGMKVALRALLESERTEQIRLTLGDIRDDPYFPDIERVLGPELTRRLPPRTQPPAPEPLLPQGPTP